MPVCDMCEHPRKEVRLAIGGVVCKLCCANDELWKVLPQNAEKPANQLRLTS